jgi:hypothetical protein
MSPAPLIPAITAVLIQDGDGSRLASKYYGNWVPPSASRAVNQSAHGPAASRDMNGMNAARAAFEASLYKKTRAANQPRGGEAEVLSNEDRAW